MRGSSRDFSGVCGVSFILDTRPHTTCGARAGALCRERRTTPAPLLPLHSTTLRRRTPQHRSCTTPPLLFRFLVRFLFRRRPPPRRPSLALTACPLAAPSLLLLSRHSPLLSTSTTLLCCAAAYPSARQRHGTVWPTASTLLCRQSKAEERSSAPLHHHIPLRSVRHRRPLPHSSAARPHRPARDHPPSTVAALAYAASPLSAAIVADHSAPRPGRGRRGALRRGRERGGERREGGRRGGTAE